MIYAKSFVGSLLDGWYHLPTLTRLEEVIGCKYMIRVNQYNDVVIVCPMMVVVTPTVVASDGEVLNRSDLVTPIKAKADIVT